MGSEKRFFVTFDRSDGAKFGVVINDDFSIDEISGEGLVADWNRQHAAERIEVGDRIVSANGMEDEDSKLEAMTGNHPLLRLELVREMPLAADEHISEMQTPLIYEGVDMEAPPLARSSSKGDAGRSSQSARESPAADAIPPAAEWHELDKYENGRVGPVLADWTSSAPAFDPGVSGTTEAALLATAAAAAAAAPAADSADELGATAAAAAAEASSDAIAPVWDEAASLPEAAAACAAFPPTGLPAGKSTEAAASSLARAPPTASALRQPPTTSALRQPPAAQKTSGARRGESAEAQADPLDFEALTPRSPEAQPASPVRSRPRKEFADGDRLVEKHLEARHEERSRGMRDRLGEHGQYQGTLFGQLHGASSSLAGGLVEWLTGAAWCSCSSSCGSGGGNGAGDDTLDIGRLPPAPEGSTSYEEHLEFIRTPALPDPQRWRGALYVPEPPGREPGRASRGRASERDRDRERGGSAERSRRMRGSSPLSAERWKVGVAWRARVGFMVCVAWPFSA